VTGPKNPLRQIVEILPALAAIAKICFFLGSSARFFAILRLAVGSDNPLRPAQFPELLVAFFLAHDIGDIEHFLIHSQ
jgi:hypothetical protein